MRTLQRVQQWCQQVPPKTWVDALIQVATLAAALVALADHHFL